MEYPQDGSRFPRCLAGHGDHPVEDENPEYP
jgi:hypothetical protein